MFCHFHFHGACEEETMPGGPQVTSWCFTINNPTTLLDVGEDTLVRYAIYQLEIGESGTEHFQGYIEFKRSCKLGRVKRALDDNTAHCEPRKGSQLEAIAYASKADTRIDGPWTYGEPSGGQGTRMDLVQLKKDLDDGMAMKDVAASHFSTFLRYNKGIQLYRSLCEAVPTHRDLDVVLYYGPTGTGKSFSASLYGEEAYWRSSSTGQYWQGYQGERVIVMDDFGGWEPYHTLLRILDIYPYRVGTKGSDQILRARKIIICSNFRPDEWYNFQGREKFDLAALVRRIHRYVVFWDRSHVGCPLKFDNFVDFKIHCTDSNN